MSSWDGRPTRERVFDAQGTNATSDDVVWYLDGVKQQTGVARTGVRHLEEFAVAYHDYLHNVHDTNSIDGSDTRLVGRANYGSVDTSPNDNNAAWYPWANEARFEPGMVTQDIVAHEFTHGLVEESGSDLIYLYESGALNESFADVFGEFLDCRTACNWIQGLDAFGNTTNGGTRSLSDPWSGGSSWQPDHYEVLLETT